jgi:hypothetical protein
MTGSSIRERENVFSIRGRKLIKTVGFFLS